MITESLLWFFAALGAFMVGVSKAGIIGVLLGALAGRWRAGGFSNMSIKTCSSNWCCY